MKGKRNFMPYHIPRKEPKNKPTKTPFQDLPFPAGMAALA